MRVHVWILAVAHIVGGFTSLLTGIAILLPMIGLGWLVGVNEGEWAATLMISGWGAVVCALCFLGSIPSFLLGAGLFMRSNIARVITIFFGVLSLFAFPIGTAWGIYTFWVLTDDDVTDWFVGGKLR